MKLKFTLTFFYLFTILISFAQKAEQAPLNSEYIKFVEKKTNKKVGYIPSPTTYVHNKVVNNDITKTDFPSIFNLNTEGFVTSVKSQGGAGHCWSFAAIGAVESRNLILGLGVYDLSEHNMATCHGFGWDEGGNQSMATAYFSRLSGPILESEDIYSDSDFSCSATDVTPQFYMTESRFLPQDAETIKYYLMNYGAIAVSFYSDDQYFNENDNTYYYKDIFSPESSNHGVLLVGWDDTKTTAGGTGAWIIKNSWGSLWGDNGFFYMSYNDTHAIESPTIYPTRKETNNIDTLLMIDRLGEISSYGFHDQKDYALIKYNVPEEHNFNQISTYVGASNSIIDIEVFQTKIDNLLTDTLAKRYNIYADYPGYHTFDIPFKVTGNFYIKITYYTPGDDFPIPVESNIAGYSSTSIESDVCWISNQGTEWIPVGLGTGLEVDLCIRAYGSKTGIQTSFTADKNILCYDSDVTFTNTSSGTISKYTWDFGKDATPVTGNTEGPHTVSYSSQGFKTIKLVIEDATGNKDSLINYNYIEVKDEINVHISAEDTIFVKENEEIELFANGADSYIWTPQSIITGSSTNSKVQVSTAADSYLYVTGTMGSCVSKDSTRLKITYSPENDDICDAITLPLSVTNGPFTNANATVEVNEPYPDTTSCTEPLQWCNENGLQNSIWFKFTVGIYPITILTEGEWDNQIALYDAASCDDIISGDDSKYELIAANDDATDTDFKANILNPLTLTEGKTYWLQMDGSGGGKEGSCTIFIKQQWPTGISSIDNSKIKVYPNPSTGNFKIDLSSVQNIDKNTRIDVISTEGAIIYSFKANSNQLEYDLSIDRKGMFILRVTTTNNKYSLPIILK
jgi:C1A family cysteine protease/PKD repeat protein